VNRLCDKCSYQNDCFDENRCPFTIVEDNPNNAKDADAKTINNFEYIKSLGFNDMAASLAKGLGVPESDIAAWLASEAK